MPVDEDVVEATRHERLSDPGDLANRGHVGQAGDVEDDPAHVRIRTTLAELDRLDHVVAAVHLEVLDVHPAQAEVQIRLVDAPLVEELRMPLVLDADDVHALLAYAPIDHAAHVRIVPGELLLHVHVRDVEGGAQGQMSEHFDVVASPLHGGPLSLGRPWGDGG